MKSYTILDFADDSEEALNEVRKLYPNVTVESVDKEPGQVKISGDRAYVYEYAYDYYTLSGSSEEEAHDLIVVEDEA